MNMGRPIKKSNTVSIEMAREVLKRQLNYINPARDDSDDMIAMQSLGLEVLLRAIADMPLEEKENLTDQVEGRNARLYFFGEVGKRLMVALGIEPEFAYQVALMVGEPCQSVDDFKGVQTEVETEFE
jgi:hypothetical protein